MLMMHSVQFITTIDRLGWLYDTSDTFYVSSAHALLDNKFLLVDDIETRWNSWVPIKLSVFIWRMCLHNIPSREILSYRGIEVDLILCPIFHNGMETR